MHTFLLVHALQHHYKILHTQTLQCNGTDTATTSLPISAHLLLGAGLKLGFIEGTALGWLVGPADGV